MVAIPPGFKVPIHQGKFYFVSAAPAKFLEDVLQVRFDCGMCNSEYLSDFIISLPHTD